MTDNSGIAVIEPETAANSSFQCVALDANEMKEARGKLHDFLGAKLVQIDTELAEVTDAYNVAKVRKWASSALYNQTRNIARRRTYYEKLLLAVDAGYTIVPNMPVDVFVIRTKYDEPNWDERTGNSYMVHELSDVEADRLPAGEGDYKSPQQKNYVTHVDVKKGDGSTESVLRRVGMGQFHEIEFPLAVAHPVIMEATDEAMKLKIFDRIGIVPQGTMRRKADPIVLGQIMFKQGYNTKIVSFLLGWHLDMRAL